MAGESQKKKSDQKFLLLFEEHPQPMWFLDPSSRTILQANPAAAELYGYALDELRGMPLSQIEVSHDVLPGKQCARHRTKSGRVIDVDVVVRTSTHNRQPAELAMLLDVSAQRQMAEQLRQAQKMEAVGMLAGGIAHDFNNLLTIITGYSQLIFNSLEPSNPNFSSVEQILKAADRAAALTGQLLSFSRRQDLQPKVLDLNRLIGGMGSMLQRLIGEDIDLRFELRPDLGQVSADPGQVEQVVMNLVVNARDAMPKGGTLTIETANVQLGAGYTSRHLTVRPGNYTLIAVSDTGTGMDPATQARVFEPFFTTKSTGRGTGLGLSTVFSIVKQSSGSVDVYSVPGRGTSVKVYFPRIDRPVTADKTEAPRQIAAGSETILVLEDDDMVRNLVRETLVREGYKVLTSADALQAPEIACDFKGKIHLLITDVVMPKVNGRELAQRLTNKRPDMKVLYMSGYSDAAIVNNGILQKQVAFLQKPFTPAMLLEKVREVLESNSERSRHAC
jgi:two-component system cell cycle sensor histidine kinase/response regulator CckA